MEQYPYRQQEENNFSEFENQMELPVMDSKYLASYMVKVYGWMFLGLLITAGVALFTASNQQILQVLISNRILFYGILLGQLFLVGYLAVRIHKMSYSTALFVFLTYASLNGLVFALILLAYDPTAIATYFPLGICIFFVILLTGIPKCLCG